MQVELLKSMHKIIMQLIILVERVNATPIGWKVTKHINEKRHPGKKNQVHGIRIKHY